MLHFGTPCVDSRGRKHAVLFAGGGARAAFEVGVLAALVQGASRGSGCWPLRSTIFCGASLGAYHATFMASHGEQGDLRAAIQDLVLVWRRQIARSSRWPDGGVYRLRGAPYFLDLPGSLIADPVRSLLDTFRAAGFWGGFISRRARRLTTSRRGLLGRVLESIDISEFFDIEPFQELVDKTIDFDRLATEDTFVATNVTHLRRGTPTVFFRPQLAGEDGRSILLASAAFPGLVSPVSVGGRPFVDGTLSMSTLYMPALAAGSDVMHVIRPWTPLRQAGEHDFSTFGISFQMMQILMVSNIYNKLHSLAHVGSAVDRVVHRASEQWLTPDEFMTPWSFERSREVLERWTPSPRGAPTEIHFYQLADTSPGTEGFLDFRADRIDRLMAEGYRIAEEHDCRTAGCWLGGSQATHSSTREG